MSLVAIDRLWRNLQTTYPVPIPSVTVPIAATAPVIDGDISDAVWSTATMVKLMDNMGCNNPLLHSTEVRLLADDKALYLAFDCREDRMNELSTCQHDYMIFMDDAVEIYLLPGCEARLGSYHFLVNAAGKILDEQYNGCNKSNLEDADPRINFPNFKASVRLFPDKWTVEIIITWADFGIEPPRDWRLNVQRFRPRKGDVKKEDQAWSPTLCANSHLPARFGRCIIEAFQATPRAHPIPKINVPIAATAPVIDGDISDAVWSTATMVKLVDNKGWNNPLLHSTEVRLLADDNALYLAFDCHENRMNELSTCQHDYSIFMDDAVEIFLLPGREARLGSYHFVVNAAGKILDEQYSGLNKDNPEEPDPIVNFPNFKASVRLFPDKWTAEIIIMWADFGIEPPRDWRLNVHRFRPQKGGVAEEEQAWSPTLCSKRFMSSYVPKRFGYCIMEAFQSLP